MRRTLTLLVALALAFGGAQTDLVFWHAVEEPSWVAWIDARVEAFNERLAREGSDYRLVAQRQDLDREILEAAAVAVREGRAPHLLLLSSVHRQRAVDSGIVRAPEADEGAGEAFLEPLTNAHTIDGALYATPFISSSLVLLGNEGLMSEVGIEELPKTFTSLLDACERLAGRARPDAACITFPLRGALFEQWIAEQGALLANRGNGHEGRATEVLLTSESAMRVGSLVRALGESGHHGRDGAPRDWDAAAAELTEGAAMFAIAPSPMVPRVTTAAQEAGFAVRAGRLPLPEGVERNGAALGGAGLWITSGHEREATRVARGFASYLTNAENMVRWHELTGYVPVRRAAVEMLRERGWFRANPNLAVAVEHLLETVPNDASAGALLGPYLEARAIIEQAMQRIYEGEMGVEDALAAAKERADALLAEYNVDHF